MNVLALPMPLRDFSALVMVIVLWGMNFIAVKFGVLEFPVWASLFFRFGLAALFLLPFCPFPKGQFLTLLMLTVLLVLGHFATMFWAIQHSPSTGMVAVIMQMTPAFAIILAFAFFREVPGKRRIIGLVVSFLGVVVIFYEPVFFDSVTAIVVTLFSAFFLASYTVMLRVRDAIPPLTIICWTSVMGGVMSLIITLLFEPSLLETVQTVSLSAWGGVVFTAIGGSILGHGAYAWLLRRQPVSLVLPFTLIIPVIPLLMGSVLFDEPLTSRIILGTVVILLGIGFIMRSKAYER
ncbi:DMT family transporter [Kiloniella sp. b19]|uniref:DMT family transporter n=1 Tax=Kiloniella sp. GXU_MW_B19 TaxID=3141326 RepID=UPI0031E0FA7B